MGKLNTIIYFNPLEGEIIEVKSPKNYVQQFRHLQKANSSLSLYQLMAGFTFVQIVLIQNFRFHVAL